MNTPHQSTPFSRRRFLRQTALMGAMVAPATRSILRAEKVQGANSDIRVAIIGLGNKGKHHVELFSAVPGVRITALCEVDPKRLAPAMDKLKQNGTTPFTAADPRRVLERNDVDAVVIATPNHWHALLTVWAIRAGKDVYVEKPVSHNVWEGERMVEEARARGRVVQAGTQYRSCPGLRAAAAWLKEGHLGKPLWGYIVWYEYRPPIGKCAPYMPEGLDYDLWCGPAPLEPLTRPKLHYDWHWVWSTGDGDMGNSSVHPVDACRMFLTGDPFPRRVISLGGRFVYDDAGQTPNTQFTLLDYPELPIVVENRNLSMEPDVVVMDHFRRVREGIILQYEGGYFAGLRAGGVVFDHQGKDIKRFRGDGGAGHQANFIQAVRSRKTADLHAPIAASHVSAALCHWANISYRLGHPTSVATCLEALGRHAPVAEGFPRLVKSLEGIGVDLAKTPFRLGPWLELDPGTGEIQRVGGRDAETLDQARRLARGSYRRPYVWPT